MGRYAAVDEDVAAQPGNGREYPYGGRLLSRSARVEAFEADLYRRLQLLRKRRLFSIVRHESEPHETYRWDA
jgi:hypothetical protein